MFDLFLSMCLMLLAIALFGCFIKWVWHSPKNVESREISKMVRNAGSFRTSQTGNKCYRRVRYTDYTPLSNLKQNRRNYR